MKIDSQGYALIMERNSQSSSEPDSAGSHRVSFMPGYTVGNVEEAWQCQQDGGYAPLTHARRGKKKRSMGSPSTRETPCEYEVPIIHGPPLSSPQVTKAEGKESLSDIEEDVFEMEGQFEEQSPAKRHASDSVSSLPVSQSEDLAEVDRPRAKSLVGITHKWRPQNNGGRRSLPSPSLLISLSKQSGVII